MSSAEAACTVTGAGAARWHELLRASGAARAAGTGRLQAEGAAPPLTECKPGNAALTTASGAIPGPDSDRLRPLPSAPLAARGLRAAGGGSARASPGVRLRPPWPRARSRSVTFTPAPLTHSPRLSLHDKALGSWGFSS